MSSFPVSSDWKSGCPDNLRLEDENWMRRAIQLAKNGQGRVEPNPMVGCVLVRNGVLVGEGWHDRFGGPHAEINALISAGTKSKGATAYVSLEPCCHHGKTGPCTEALVNAGIRRVVAAKPDPYPEVRGKGFLILNAHGIETWVGCCQNEATTILMPYLRRICSGRPWVIAKWAMSLDGKIASRTGASQWISCPESRKLVHQWRAKSDAILTGSGTVLQDDPLLTARPAGPRIPARVVLDRRGRISPNSQLAKTAKEIPLLVATSIESDGEWRRILENTGAEILIFPSEPAPFFNSLMNHLGKRGWTNLMVEAGPELVGALFDQNLIDEFRVFVSPTVIGGVNARGPLDGLGSPGPWTQWGDMQPEIERIGPDMLIRSVRKDEFPVVDNLEKHG